MNQDVPYRFCPVCGGILNTQIIKENEPARLVCTQCRFVLYQDPKVVACTIVDMGGRILLLKRSIKPRRGKWVLPGGFVDRGETVPAAAIREAEEECGIGIGIRELLGVYSYDGYPVVVVVYVAEHRSGDPVAGDEVLAASLFRPEEIPWEDLAFQSTTEALKDYLRLGNP
jgi:ADP-ribose pyrophosphatase YjhB (NUDIX family)